MIVMMYEDGYYNVTTEWASDYIVIENNVIIRTSRQYRWLRNWDINILKKFKLRKLKMDKKIINITHRDMDGLVCSILLNDFCNAKDIDFEKIECTYRNIDSTLKKVIDENCYIFITDISIVDESQFPELKNMKNVFFIDHHPRETPSIIKNQYHAINKGAGCKMTMDYIEKKYNYKFSKDIKRLVLIASDYDTWTHKYHISKQMNRLFYFHGVNKFFYRFAAGFNGKWTDEEKKFFIAKNAEVQHIKDTLMIEEISNNVRLICVTKEIDEMAEYVQQKDNVDYVIVYNSFLKSLSFRSTEKAKIHMGEFLNQYGGGGHKCAAAVKIKDENEIFPILEILVTTLGE